MSELIELIYAKKNIVVCSNDAGGAEVLSSFIAANGISAKFLLCGPAIEIFQRKLEVSDRLLTELPPEYDLLLASTGWSTDFEFNNMFEATNSGAQVIAALDHWFAYPERFERNGNVIGVTHLLVFDAEAKRKATSVFPNSKIYLEENFYLKDLVARHQSMATKDTKIEYDFLFLCEPKSLDLNPEKQNDYSDIDSLKYFLNFLFSRNLTNARVLVRPHPSEELDKYVPEIPADFINIIFDKKMGLDEAISISETVVGCNTMAMIVALEFGKNVYSVVPPPSRTKLSDSRIQQLTAWERSDFIHED